LEHCAGRVVDAARRDLARLPGKDVHGPGALREGRVRGRVPRVARRPGADLAELEEDPLRLGAGEPGLVVRRRGRGGGEWGRGRRSGLRDRNENGRGYERDYEPSQLRNDQSLFPRKFKGVT